MEFPQPLREAVLLRRYKRFLADVELPDGGVLTLHCPNTGSMKNCREPGSRVWYTDSGDPKRKYPCTWQIVEVGGRHRVGVNTALANRLAREAIGNGSVAPLAGYGRIRAEVAYGARGSRIDLLLEEPAGGGGPCHVEVKSVSLGLGGGLGAFPDAVTERGRKHLRELTAVRAAGGRAVLLFCVQHSGVDAVVPADDIDPEYGRLLREAHRAGVEVLAFGARFDIARSRAALRRRLAVRL